MYKANSEYLRRLAYILVVSSSYKVEDIPKIFRLLIDFLKHKDNVFSISDMNGKQVPLTMDKNTEEFFKTFTSEFPNIYRGGKGGMPVMNFLYTLGQLLTTLDALLELTTIDNSPQEKKDQDAEILSTLIKIWSNGKSSGMSPDGIIPLYDNKSNESTINSLIPRMEKTANKVESILKVSEKPQKILEPSLK